MEKFVIKAKFRCLVEIKNQTTELDENKYIVIETEKKDIVKVYPLESCKECYSIAYSFVLDNEHLKKDNIKIIKFEKHTEIILQEKIIAKNTYLLEKKTKNNIVASVTNYPHTFEIIYNNIVSNFFINTKIENPNIEISNDVVKLVAKSEKDYLCLFHLKENKFYEFHGEICFAENQFSVFENINNIAKHGRYSVYSINSSGVSIVSNELVYIKNEPKKTANETVIPFAFFESIKEKDYNLARSYTSEMLASKLSDAHLEKYFGEIVEIEEYNINQIAIITKKDNNYFGEIFEVELVNNEIVNCLQV